VQFPWIINQSELWRIEPSIPHDAAAAHRNLEIWFLTYVLCAHCYGWRDKRSKTCSLSHSRGAFLGTRFIQNTQTPWPRIQFDNGVELRIRMSSKSDLTFVVSNNDGWRVTFRLCKSRMNVLGKSTSMLNVAKIIDSVGRAIGLRGTAVVKFWVDQENSTHWDCITWSKLVANKQSFLLKWLWWQKPYSKH
jgi:hypothetical protein